MTRIIDFKKENNSAENIFKGQNKRTIKVLKESLEAIDENTNSDIYGEGDIIEDFEKKMAKILGKEKALFFPSGTMAQQIALRVWSDKAGIKKVSYHPYTHLETREEEGLKKLHGIKSILIGTKDRIFNFEDVRNIKEKYSSLLLELPQRDLGGDMPEWDQLLEISKFCKESNVKFHLDGARLWESQPYYGKPIEEICDLFDSVYVSFYKGLGGIAGAILAGSEEFIEECFIWKKRYGGNLISLYPYIISSNYYFDKNINKMKTYWEESQKLAEKFNEIDNIKTIPIIPKCNMFHVEIRNSEEKIRAMFDEIYLKCDAVISPEVVRVDKNLYRMEISIGDKYMEISKTTIENIFKIIHKYMDK